MDALSISALQSTRQEANAATDTQLNELIEAFKVAAEIVQTDPKSATRTLIGLQQQLQRVNSSINGTLQKEKANAFAKFGKVLDKSFKSDLNLLYDSEHTSLLNVHAKEPIFHPLASRVNENEESTTALSPLAVADDEMDRSLRQAIYQNILFMGHFSLAEQYAEELGAHETVESMDGVTYGLQAYRELHTILNGLYHRNVQPGLDWCYSMLEKDHSSENGSDPLSVRTRLIDLTFELHRLQFLMLFTQHEHVELLSGQRENKQVYINRALKYAKQHFGMFAETQLSGIYSVCCSERTVPELESDHLVRSFAAVITRFRRDYSALVLHHTNPTSSLACVVGVGSSAIPKLIKLAQVQRVNKTEWTQEDELPVELPIPDGMRFHSVFVCPVSKDVATLENPPMRLVCGHVVCKECVVRLARGGTFKCPYCPQESMMTQASQVHF